MTIAGGELNVTDCGCWIVAVPGSATDDDFLSVKFVEPSTLDDVARPASGKDSRKLAMNSSSGFCAEVLAMGSEPRRCAPGRFSTARELTGCETWRTTANELVTAPKPDEEGIERLGQASWRGERTERL